jgi:hypothetical protein
MKADAKPTLESVAALLAKGPPPDWLLPHLRQWAEIIGNPTQADDEVERKLYAAAKYLQDWLPMYAMAADKLGVEYPLCIDYTTTALEELVPFLASEVDQPTDGPKPDRKRRLCAAVCLEVWRKLRGSVQPYSPNLWAACEAYWQACGHDQTSTTGRLKNWEPFLVWAKQHPTEHLVTTPKII